MICGRLHLDDASDRERCMLKAGKKRLEWLWNHKGTATLSVALSALILTVAYWAATPNTSPAWTGFGQYQKPTLMTEPTKTLWDWLQLLIVPIALAALTLWFSIQSKRRDEEAADKRADIDKDLSQDRLREAALQTYIGRIAELVANNAVSETDPAGAGEASVLARAYTLSTLRGLDQERRRTLIEFLYELGLIDKRRTMISLAGADLRGMDLTEKGRSATFLYKSFYDMQKLFHDREAGPTPQLLNLSNINFNGANLTNTKWAMADLAGATLRKADLSGSTLDKVILANADLEEAFMQSVHVYFSELQAANLEKTDLSNAQFVESDFSGANLVQSILRRVILRGCTLVGANLSGSILSGADLTDADLSEVDLSNTDVSTFQLEKAKSLAGAIMRDGAKYEGSDVERYLRGSANLRAKSKGQTN